MAIYPDGIKSWTNVADNTDHVMAAHINEAYEEIIALEENAAKQSQLSNPNLLINPFFQINQRGQSSYSGITYTVDGWEQRASSDVTTVNVGSVTFGKSTNVGPFIIQVVENLSALVGQQVTFSVKILAINGVIRLRFLKTNYGNEAESGNIDSTGIFSFTHTITSETIGVAIVATTVAAKVTLKSAKLELGSVSTLANDAPPKIATDLAECQRYLLAHPSATWYRADLVTANAMQFTVPTPVTMRISPSIIVNGEMYIRNTAGANQTGFIFSQIVRNNAVIITATKSEHGVSDGCLILNNVLFSAEL